MNTQTRIPDSDEGNASMGGCPTILSRIKRICDLLTSSWKKQECLRMTSYSVAYNCFRYWHPVLLLPHNQTIDLHQAEKRAPGKVPLME